MGAREAALQSMADAELTEQAQSLRYRAQCGEPLSKLVVEVYAVVREAARRTIGLRHYHSQLIGGLALFDGGIPEMQTGEGKTLVATLPLTLRALVRKGALLATSNDYLAARDAEWMGPIYRMLGLSVGVVGAGSQHAERRRAYSCDVTYGTAREFGFDFLRDRLALRTAAEQGSASPIRMQPETELPSEALFGSIPAGCVQRPPYFMLVDEADSLLIDEARTPLILSGSPPETAAVFEAGCRWGAEIVPKFLKGVDFEFDPHHRRLALTSVGTEKLHSFSTPPELDGVKLYWLYEFVERAILVSQIFQRDQHYVVNNGAIVIVDEFTGRASEGRRWQQGIHQAIEAREGVKITAETIPLARITVQDYFHRFPHLAGMTGTALSASRELRKVYRLQVVPIPTNRPSRRAHLPVRVCPSATDKWRAISALAAECHFRGRAILIGTRSIEQSEHVSRVLTEAKIPHEVLNARDPAREAAIVAQAGRRGAVTVATNMAGRGTDIQIEAATAELGGLFVVGTEFHDSARIDRQLEGRCARQGDPGTFQQFLALDDELIGTACGPDYARQFVAAYAPGLATASLDEQQQIVPIFDRAQQILERRHRDERTAMQKAEHERQKLHQEMGQDPYLDAVSD